MKSLPFIHPNLTIGITSAKGRLVSVACPIKQGEVVLVDAPNALVPAMLVDEPPYLLCSRHGCYRRIPHLPSKPTPKSNEVSCPDQCITEVVWCSDECRSRDEIRHAMECHWLKRSSAEIRDVYGDSDFGLIWLIARILIVRHLDDGATLHTKNRHRNSNTNGHRHLNEHQGYNGHATPNGEVTVSHFGRRGWDAVWNLEGEPEYFSIDKISRWETMTENYFTKDTLHFEYPTAEVVKLICKVETNSFGLYPGVTGGFPVTSSAGRGDYYGGGIYPTAAMFNHACNPNITHHVDELGRRFFKASRDIEVDEECCISYFDLAEFLGPSARREAIRTSWDFICDCRRCEEDFDIPSFLKAIDLN